MNILITNPVHEILIQGLKSLGCIVDYQPNISLAETTEIIGDYDGVIINTKIKATAGFIARAKRLKFIARLGSGLDIIDLEAATDRNIKVMRAAGANANAVAEHVIGMILMLKNKLHFADQAVRLKNWDREGHRGTEMSDSTIGIIGFGHNGSLLAKRLKGFDVRVLAYDPYVEIRAKDVEQVSSLEAISTNCNIISFHVPLTEETHHMGDKDFFATCDQNPLVVNTSRGKVINTADLIDALDREILSGAALDVFENEKPQTYTNEESALYNRLFEMKQVVLSPHVAGWTVESYENISREMLEKVSRFLLKG